MTDPGGARDTRPGLRIFTIGYEGTTQPDLIAALMAAGVERLIDVRAVPLSRKPGFSKTNLASGLREAGIDYVHLRRSAPRRKGARRRASTSMTCWSASIPARWSYPKP